MAGNVSSTQEKPHESIGVKLPFEAKCSHNYIKAYNPHSINQNPLSPKPTFCNNLEGY